MNEHPVQIAVREGREAKATGKSASDNPYEKAQLHRAWERAALKDGRNRMSKIDTKETSLRETAAWVPSGADCHPNSPHACKWRYEFETTERIKLPEGYIRREVYEAAVQGRKDFRQSYKVARRKIDALERDQYDILSEVRLAINPPDLGGISLATWNDRLKAATVKIDAALRKAEGRE